MKNERLPVQVGAMQTAPSCYMNMSIWHSKAVGSAKAGRLACR